MSINKICIRHQHCRKSFLVETVLFEDVWVPNISVIISSLCISKRLLSAVFYKVVEGLILLNDFIGFVHPMRAFAVSVEIVPLLRFHNNLSVDVIYLTVVLLLQ